MKTAAEVLKELESRFKKADKELLKLMEKENTYTSEYSRLFAKRAGVLLGLSYVQDEMRYL